MSSEIRSAACKHCGEPIEYSADRWRHLTPGWKGMLSCPAYLDPLDSRGRRQMAAPKETP